MTRSRIDLATLEPAELRKRLRRLQAQMKNLWDSWQAWGLDFPVAAAANKERFEEMEKQEAELLTLVRGQALTKGERDDDCDQDEAPTGQAG